MTKENLRMIENYLYCIKEDFKNALSEPNVKIKNLKVQTPNIDNDNLSLSSLNIELSYCKNNFSIEKKIFNINLEEGNLFAELKKLALRDNTAKDICKLIFNFTDKECVGF